MFDAYRVFGTGDDAETARVALIRARGVGHLHAMNANLDPSEKPEAPKIGAFDAAHFEDVVGAHIDAVAFTLAGRLVYDGPPRSGSGLAFLTGARRIGCRAAGGFDGSRASLLHSR